MPGNPREVFETLTQEGGEDPPEVALLAYGAFAAELYEWVEHEEHRQGRPPSDEEINAWIAQIPDARLKRIRDEALESFGLAAKAFLEPEILRQVKKRLINLYYPRYGASPAAFAHLALMLPRELSPRFCLRYWHLRSTTL